MERVIKRINWDEARDYYLTDKKVTYLDVSKKYGVSHVAVRAHGKRKGWVEQKEKMHTMVAAEINQKVAQQLAEMAGSATLLHAELGGRFIHIVNKALDAKDARGNYKIKVESMKDARELALAGAMLQRQALGLDKVQQSQNNVVIMVQTTNGSTVDITKVV